MAYSAQATIVVKEDVMDEGNDVIVKSNSLIEASYKLTLNEQRLMLYTISMIPKDAKELSLYKICVKDFIKKFNINGKGAYDQIKRISNSLTSKNIAMKRDDTDGYLYMAWVASAEYSEGYLTIELSQKMKPYLLELNECFSRYSLSDVSKFNSIYGIRIFELVKQVEKIRYRYFELNELKKILSVDNKYPKYSNFNSKVLKVGVKEINKHTDLNVSVEEKKEGRRVIGIKFLVNKKKKENKQNEIDQVDDKKEVEIDMNSYFAVEQSMKIFVPTITKTEIESIIKASNGNIHTFFAKYSILSSKIPSGNVSNPVGFMISAIKNDYDEFTNTQQFNEKKCDTIDFNKDENSYEDLYKLDARNQ